MEEKNTTRICVPVCVKQCSEIVPAIARAAAYANIIELRIDCLTEAEFHDIKHELAELCKQSLCPIIVTLRPAEQGGRRELDRATRFEFWCSDSLALLRDGQILADLELDIATEFSQSEAYLTLPDWNRVICSHHDLMKVPDDLEKIYEQMAATPARILKIAVQANDITDCIPVLKLLAHARRDGREMIAIAMGDAGIMTRILGPARGAYLTYGALNTSRATAAGQITAAELRDLYRVNQIDQQTEIMGIVGQPVAHSISPRMHNAAFAASDHNAVYIPFEVSQIESFMRRMTNPCTREFDWNLRGLSVTAPHKISIMQHLDWVEPAALEIGAVNTVVIDGQSVRGYNTDASAVLMPLENLIALEGARVAVIGAGGVARALLWSLRKAGAHVTVFARDIERAQPTAEQFGADFAKLNGAAFDGYEIVVNATPLGTSGLDEDKTPAVATQLRGAKVAYDLVYNPLESLFMREALEAGCQCIGGLEMLVAQAAEQFKIWIGSDAPIDVMRDAALKALRK